jgi:hypothetical protein
LGSLQGGKHESKRPTQPAEKAIETKAPSLQVQPEQELIAPPPQPREFSEFHSNLGRQPIVEKLPQTSKNWIGVTPNELLPRSKLLGSMKNRSYQSFNAPKETSGDPVENTTTKPDQPPP